MSSYFMTDTPTVYTDMNVFRYLACGDIQIAEPNCFQWVYSHVHLDEVYRSGNTDALEGMKILRAVEIADISDEKSQLSGKVELKNYLDPYKRYDQHLENISGYEGMNDALEEYLLRLLGADNFNELSQSPDRMYENIERLTANIEPKVRDELLKKAEIAFDKMRFSINTHLKDRMPIDETRKAMGLTSEKRKDIVGSQSPIDSIWNVVSSSMNGVTKDQLFGFEAIPGIEGLQQQDIQHVRIARAHMVLNMFGISPDQGLSKREKIKNIMSDGQHMGMGSYCVALLSADRRFCDKARMIYEDQDNITQVLHFEFKKDMVIRLKKR